MVELWWNGYYSAWACFIITGKGYQTFTGNVIIDQSVDFQVSIEKAYILSGRRFINHKIVWGVACSREQLTNSKQHEWRMLSGRQIQGYDLSVRNGINCVKLWARRGIAISFMGDEGWFASGMEQEFRLTPAAFVIISKGVLSPADLMPISVLGEQVELLPSLVIGQQEIYRLPWKKMRWVISLLKWGEKMRWVPRLEDQRLLPERSYRFPEAWRM